jgi:hypothetical protein
LPVDFAVDGATGGGTTTEVAGGGGAADDSTGPADAWVDWLMAAATVAFIRAKSGLAETHHPLLSANVTPKI